MNTKSLAVTIAVLVFVIGMVWYTRGAEPSPEGTSDTFGGYPYECDEHVGFTMTPSADFSTMTIEASQGAAYPAKTTLSAVAATSGARFEGGGYLVEGKGESVTLTSNGSSLQCSPVPDPDSAPLNFGD